MADAAAWVITSQEIKLLSFQRQNIVHKICEEAELQGRPWMDPHVIAAVVRYFNLGPAPHGVFNTLVHQLARSF